MKQLLDHGYVELIEARGSDRFIAQTARTSTSTEKTEDEDFRLVRRLIRDEHTSPVEFASVVLQIKAPLFVARQWMRHRAGTFNEFSGRYSEFPEEFYVPELSRMQAQSTFNKQGSAETLDGDLPALMHEQITTTSKVCYQAYQNLLDKGLTRELARMVLPTNYYTVFRWNVNLHNLFHFLRLREDAHAQYEIRVYAEAIHEILKESFPVATEAYEQHIAGRITISPELAHSLAWLASESPNDGNSELTAFLARFKS
jgi:thymidylate synthase (FAD)